MKNVFLNVLLISSGVTESLCVGFFGGTMVCVCGGWGVVGRASSGGGGGARERHRNDFFPITYIVHNQKSNGGPMGWGGHGPQATHTHTHTHTHTPLVTPLFIFEQFIITYSIHPVFLSFNHLFILF